MPPGRQVPEGERAVLDAHDEEAAVREQGERAHGAVGDGQRADELARGGVPEPDLGAAPGRDRSPVRRKREGGHGALQAADRPQGRRRPHASGRDVAVDLLAAAERCRPLELRQGLGPLAQGQVDATQQLVGARASRMGGAGLFQAPQELGVRQVAFDPRGEAGVVGGLDVLCLGLESALPQRRRLGRPAEVHERDGAVAEGVRRASTAPRLPPRVRPPRRAPPRPPAGRRPPRRGRGGDPRPAPGSSGPGDPRPAPASPGARRPRGHPADRRPEPAGAARPYSHVRPPRNASSTERPKPHRSDRRSRAWPAACSGER